MTTPASYPSTRSARQVPSALTYGGLTPVPLPTVRILPVEFNQTGAAVGVMVLGPFQGPGVIDEFWGTLYATAGGGGNTPSLAFYVGDTNQGDGINQAAGFIPAGIRIHDLARVLESSATTHVDALGYPLREAGTTTEAIRIPLRVPVTMNPWFLKVRLATLAGVGAHMYGYVRVLEGVPPNLLPTFL